MPVTVFLESSNWREKTHLEGGWCHSISWGPRVNRKESGEKPAVHQHLSLPDSPVWKQWGKPLTLLSPQLEPSPLIPPLSWRTVPSNCERNKTSLPQGCLCQVFGHEHAKRSQWLSYRCLHWRNQSVTVQDSGQIRILGASYFTLMCWALSKLTQGIHKVSMLYDI